jgi:hypothetical protein
MKRLIPLAFLAIGSCVQAQYHAAGAPSMSVIDANLVCGHAYDALNRQYALGASIIPIVGGLAGAVALSASQSASVEHAQADLTYEACMAGQGYRRD